MCRYHIGHFGPVWSARLKCVPVFSQVWNTDRLLTSVDSVAIGRPPEQVNLGYLYLDRLSVCLSVCYVNLKCIRTQHLLHAKQPPYHYATARSNCLCVCYVSLKCDRFSLVKSGIQTDFKTMSLDCNALRCWETITHAQSFALIK